MRVAMVPLVLALAACAPGRDPGPIPRAPELDVAAVAHEALVTALELDGRFRELAVVVGLFIGSESELQDAIADGHLDDAAARASARLAGCDVDVEHVAGARSLLVTFPSPCALANGVFVEGAVSLALDDDVVGVALQNLVTDAGSPDASDGHRWNGVIFLSVSLAPVIGVISTDILYQGGLPLPFTFVAFGSATYHDDATADLDADAWFIATGGAAPVELDGRVCAETGRGYSLDGVTGGAAGCRTATVSASVDYACAASSAGDAASSLALLAGLVAAAMPGLAEGSAFVRDVTAPVSVAVDVPPCR